MKWISIIFLLALANGLYAQEVVLKDSIWQDSIEQFPRVQTAKLETDRKMRTLFQNNNLSYPPKDIYWRCFKYENEVELWARDSVHQSYKKLKTYTICEGSGTHGPKRKMGDAQVPEGFYYLDLYNPNSSYFLSMRINYPNKSDSILGDKYSLGGAIYIHGACVTIGCLPMQNDPIKEIFWLSLQCQGQKKDSSLVPIDIFPLRMSDINMKVLRLEFGYVKHKMEFWENIKVGYTYFELNKKRPEFTIDNKGKYVFTQQLVQEKEGN